MRQPTGTVTMRLSHIEGSTRLVESVGTERYAQALARDREVRAAFERHAGYEVDCETDASFVAFATAREALSAAGSNNLQLVGLGGRFAGYVMRPNGRGSRVTG